jgi:Protein of unknown function (DUF2490)
MQSGGGCTPDCFLIKTGMYFKNKLKKVNWCFTVLLLFPYLSFAQEQRLADNNTIGWFVYTGTFKLKSKLSLHSEYQWRRVNGIKDWQQGLLRAGINYAIRKDVSLNAGYAFAQTFPYGDYPNANSFPEHRIFEQVVLKQAINKIDLAHRFTLEQRFVGRVIMVNNEKNIDWNYLNRIRYRLRTEIPIDRKQQAENKWRIILQDELFIGFGKNVGANIFDQNRVHILLGYKLNKNIKLETGYLSQVLQQGKKVNDKAVFQYNNGFMIATHLSF